MSRLLIIIKDYLQIFNNQGNIFYMSENSTHQKWLKEGEILKGHRETNPELFVHASPLSEEDIFSQIGINTSFPSRTEGYLRLLIQDFIVEEISEKQEISEIEPKETEFPEGLPIPFTLYADLVKTGISSSEALEQLSRLIGISVNKIGRAGYKDIKALASQRIAFSNIDFEIYKKIRNSSFPNFFLTNFSFGKGSISSGQLYGNRFTIFIRTKEKAEKKWLSEKLKKLEKEGFLNFYQVQRFGTPRFLSHFFGKLILQGKYEETVFAFLCKPGLKEIPLIRNFRKEAEESFGEWEKMEEVFKKLLYTFRNELRLISYLKKHPRNFIGALIFFEDQTTLWVYAYTSYLFNSILSLSKKSELPEKIPLFLNDNPKDWEIYKHWINENEIESFRKSIQPFHFLRLKRRLVKTRILPKKIVSKILPEGIALSFTLEKGVYATTFLMNIFELKQGSPLPEWLKDKEYDIKDVLGIGSMKETKKILGKYMVTDFNKES